MSATLIYLLTSSVFSGSFIFHEFNHRRLTFDSFFNLVKWQAAALLIHGLMSSSGPYETDPALFFALSVVMFSYLAISGPLYARKTSLERQRQQEFTQSILPELLRQNNMDPQQLKDYLKKNK